MHPLHTPVGLHVDVAYTFYVGLPYCPRLPRGRYAFVPQRYPIMVNPLFMGVLCGQSLGPYHGLTAFLAAVFGAASPEGEPADLPQGALRALLHARRRADAWAGYYMS